MDLIDRDGLRDLLFNYIKEKYKEQLNDFSRILIKKCLSGCNYIEFEFIIDSKDKAVLSSYLRYKLDCNIKFINGCLKVDVMVC